MNEPAEDMDLGAGAEPPADDGGLPPEGKTPDVFADVAADGGVEEAPGGLAGDGATLEEMEQEPPVEEAPINGGEEEPAPAPAEEPPAEPEPEPTPEPEPAPPAAEPEPEKAAEEPKPAASKGGKKGTTERIYHVLQQGEDGSWVTPESLKDGIKASNGEAAMRSAYTELVDEDSDDPVTLAVIPAHYWKPKTVRSKVKRDRAIEIA